MDMFPKRGSVDRIGSLVARDPLAAQRSMQHGIERVVGIVSMARTLLESRRGVDLAGLDAMVGRLCAGVLDLPPEQGLALRPRLSGLLGDLDTLGEMLRSA